MIVITGIRDIHIDSIREDGGISLARELSHVYHFYLFGERGRSGNMKLPALGNPKVPVSLCTTTLPLVLGWIIMGELFGHCCRILVFIQVINSYAFEVRWGQLEWCSFRDDFIVIPLHVRVLFCRLALVFESQTVISPSLNLTRFITYIRTKHSDEAVIQPGSLDFVLPIPIFNRRTKQAAGICTILTLFSQLVGVFNKSCYLIGSRSEPAVSLRDDQCVLLPQD